MGVPFVMSLTAMRAYARAQESNMAAVFVGLRLSAVGTECEVLWFLLVWRTVLPLRNAVYLEDLLPGCSGWSRKLWAGSEKNQL